MTSKNESVSDAIQKLENKMKKFSFLIIIVCFLGLICAVLALIFLIVGYAKKDPVFEFIGLVLNMVDLISMSISLLGIISKYFRNIKLLNDK